MTVLGKLGDDPLLACIDSFAVSRNNPALFFRSAVLAGSLRSHFRRFNFQWRAALRGDLT
jgi:hypothetical protein